MSDKSKDKKKPQESAAFNDVAAESDSLGMETKCKGVADFLYNCRMPMTLAIQGDWGTGKSTCMKIISKHLRDMNRDLCLIEFNTWQFSLINDGSTLIENLLNVMCQKFETLSKNSSNTDEKDGHGESFESKKSGLLTKIRKFISGVGRETLMDNMLTRVLLCGRDAFADQNGTTLSPEQIQVLLDAAESRREDSAQRVLELCDSIKTLVSELTAHTNIGDRVFVFIDDLDRLQPEMAVGFMECLKNFMDFPGFVFVLAVDRPVVNIGLKAKYGSDFDMAKAGYFFDKIIQVPFTLPVNSYNIETYMKSFLGDGADPETVKLYVNLLTEFDEHNPRSIKRSFNVLQLYEYMMKADTKREALNEMGKFKLYSLLLLQLLREKEYKALTDLVISFGDNAETLRTELNAAMAPENIQGGEPPQLELSDMQRVVLECFIGGDKELSTEEVKELMSFAALTNENTAERGDNAGIINTLTAIYSCLKNGPLQLIKDWNKLDDVSSTDSITSFSAEAKDGEGHRRLTLKWEGRGKRLNLSLYPPDMTADTDRNIYFSGLEDSFYDKSEDSKWYRNKYAYFYVPSQGRITVLSFDRYTPGGPLDTLLRRCGMIE